MTPAGPSRWTSPGVVREKATLWWRSGRLLRELHDPDHTQFPVHFRLTRPTAAEVADRFAEVRAWAQAHHDAAARGGWTVELKRVPVRALGPQEIPAVLVVPDVRTALALLGSGEQRDVATFGTCVAQARAAGGWALQVALSRPLEVVAAAPDWPALLAVAHWVAANPRPGVHIRALPVPGAHTKLVETNRGLLTALLVSRLPDDAIDTGAATFEGKFGFATGERHVVLRAPGALVGLHHLAVAEVTWPAAGLAGIDPGELGVTEVVVVENRACLPMIPVEHGRIVVWGAGYGAGELLAGVDWLARVPVVYWGDIDTHGMAILSGVRAAVPHVRSVLMDLDTLRAHAHRAGAEPTPRADDLPHLTEEEHMLYDLLRAGTGTRVEQEHLRPNAVVAAFGKGPAAARAGREPSRGRPG
ncbi:MAG TPA: Wadjet anti-phage system protein JetD domain-containing protein, partial [Mycobacteriales bacterium]|nr:Wadjet anti-phage system protein JetD domain-containing protein [Mycobacteriales bacterium]